MCQELTMHLLLKGSSFENILHRGRLLYCRYILETQSLIGQYRLGSEIHDHTSLWQQRSSRWFCCCFIRFVVCLRIACLPDFCFVLFVCHLFIFNCLYFSLSTFHSFCSVLFLPWPAHDDSSASIPSFVREKSRREICGTCIQHCNQNKVQQWVCTRLTKLQLML